MLILKFFKVKDGLPDPRGPLSQSLSSRAISGANSKVTQVIGGSAARKLPSTSELRRRSRESVVEA